VLVSHDRHLLTTVADEFLLVHGGRAVPFDGDLTDYARWLGQQEEQPAASAVPAGDASAAASAGAPAETADARKQRRRLEAQRRASLSPLRDAVAAAEQELERLAQARTQIEAELAGATGGTDRQRVAVLVREQGRLVRAIEQAEAAWLRACEALEAQRDSVQ
jgi:ATP-binding cassette subfamily F protein 3